MWKTGFSRLSIALDKRPLVTRMTLAGMTFSIGDTIAQHIDGTVKEHKLQPKRVFRMFIWGSCLFAPFVHGWFKILDRTFPAKTMKTVLVKTFLDQTISGPTLNASLMAYLIFSTGGTFEQVKDKWRRDYFRVIKTQWSVWPMVHIVNFRFVSHKWRLPFVNVVSIFWSTYASYINSDHTRIEKIQHTIEDPKQIPPV